MFDGKAKTNRVGRNDPMKQRKFWPVARRLFGLFFAACLCFALPLCHGAGEGSGGGGGPAVPLEMDWSFPQNGETNVSLTPIIQCKFSHNVAHTSVQRRNKTLFSVQKKDGTPVAAEVYMVDAQIEFSKRQYAYLIPKAPLAPHTTYVVHVAEGVQAKNGMATERAQSFSFTTGGTSDTVPLMIDVPSPTPAGTQAGSPSPSEGAGQSKSPATGLIENLPLSGNGVSPFASPSAASPAVSGGESRETPIGGAEQLEQDASDALAVSPAPSATLQENDTPAPAQASGIPSGVWLVVFSALAIVVGFVWTAVWKKR